MRHVAAAVALALTVGGVAFYATADSGTTTATPATSTGPQVITPPPPPPRPLGVLGYTNMERRKHGCGPLRSNPYLRKGAQRHAADMSRRDYLAHDTRGGRDWDQRIDSTGAQGYIGENIARGFGNPSAVVEAWMDSPLHRKNILNCKFRRLGVGYVTDGDYWVQDFAQRIHH